MPVLRTKRIPVKTLRKSRCLRPGKRKRRGGGGGSNGWSRSQSASVRRGIITSPPWRSAVVSGGNVQLLSCQKSLFPNALRHIVRVGHIIRSGRIGVLRRVIPRRVTRRVVGILAA